MTLIIGLNCKDGVILVSDRKVTDINANKEKWVEKIHKPLSSVTLFYGASGYAHLFKQFNRRIPLLVNQRIREFELRNYGIMAQSGVNYYEALGEVEEGRSEEIQKSDVKKDKKIPVPEQRPSLPKPPLIYGHEDFIQDCQELISGLCKDEQGFSDNYLDVLLILLDAEGTRLHHISYNGEEETDYCAIGRGSIFVNEFLDKFYSFEKDLDYCIKLAMFCILYVQKYVRDKSVGIEENRLPDIQVILTDGRFGPYKFTDEAAVLEELKEKVNGFIQLQESLNF